MHVGLQIPYFKYPGGESAIRGTLKDIAQAAETAGFYSIWVMDHFFQLEGMIGPADDPMLEGYSTLSYIAGVTEKVKLGTLVTGVVYRYPGVLIKTVTTLDVLSGGRAYFGVGAAWYEKEARSLGVPYPSTSGRFELLEDTLKMAHQMWKGDRSAFDGTHVHAEATINSPQALSKPHPPILIGGMGEKKTLRMIAQYGDATNLFAAAGMDVLRHKLDVLKQHCDDLGRDYNEIEKTTLASIHGDNMKDPAEIVAFCKELAGLGVTHAIFNMPDAHEPGVIAALGKDVVPAVAGL